MDMWMRFACCKDEYIMYIYIYNIYVCVETYVYIYIYTSSHLSIDQESSFPSSYFNTEALKELEPSMGHQIRKAAWRFNIVVWG